MRYSDFKANGSRSSNRGGGGGSGGGGRGGRGGSGGPGGGDLFGHHLALNITISGNHGVLTPTPTGAQSATFQLNGQTIRPVGRESDKALALMQTLDDSQRQQAILKFLVADLVKRLEQVQAASSVAVGIVRTILQPGEWSLTDQDFTRLRVACGSNSCRREVDSTEHSLQSPIGVSFNESIIDTRSVRVGPFTAVGDEQLRKILQNFPPGTQFRMQPVGRSWADQQRADRIRNVFMSLGLELLP